MAQDLESVVIRFAGDSGDGIQLTGTEFTHAVALGGSDIATFPDIPAEIRAPAGSLAGVSGFQLQFSSQEIFTAGDAPDVLVAMNPAALKTNLPDLPKGGLLIVDSGTFRNKGLAMAGYEVSPLADDSLEGYRLVAIDISKNVQATQKGSGLSTKEIQRTRNFYALGVLFWLYGRPPETEIGSIERKFARRPEIAEANVRSFRAGYHFGETCELFDASYRVPPAQLEPGTYRNITGNEATALGLIVAGQLADRHLFYGSYPITPASDVLHVLSNHRRYGLTTFQAEDEIAAVTAAIGASFGGSIGVTGTSGPGFALKQEGIGLAVMAELPLVVLDIQRAGPSTGLPTKTEQADLSQALWGRNSESPVVVLAPRTPADCFRMAIEAVRIAVRHMCPVIFLSDGSIASGSEAWKLPAPEELEPIEIHYRSDAEGFMPYLRDEETLARPWAIPGTPGLEHRIGGLEKEDRTGNVSYDPLNHEHMVRMRQAKIDRVADYIPAAEVEGDEAGQLLFVAWGGTYGAIHQAVRVLRNQGHRVGHLHLGSLSPFPHGIAEILSRFERVLVPELNRGQLRDLLRARFLIDALGLNKIQGRPFQVREVIEAGQALLSGPSAREVSL
ncbi:MAG: 2-oxoacid:acceptor oxidoreductase subunit alpha [Myxococcota bacterium]|nr:2-oxoacid:acceptor oxidoreductase subunit alpha [Myxococcota bacterium]